MQPPLPAGPEFADYNLLFGVLALQTEFIDQRQFVDACGAWAVRRDLALAELLVERGWLSAEDRRQLEQLVERKLSRHAGNAGASLRAIHDPPARQAVAQAALQFPFIKDAVTEAGLWNFDPATDDTVDEVEADPRGRFEFLEHTPRLGGIGQVWRVRDKALGRVLALKELRPDYRLDKQVRESFFREAQVNAQLTHPNIVPLFEFVRPPGHAPFCTMQFIEGHTLTDAIEQYHAKRRQGKETPLDLRELLTAFVAVCQAVGYAHDHGVLHRDLKGHNVVVGNHGEVFLLDWGLAKVQGDRRQALNLATAPVGLETQHGARLGTPSYMAPEQAAGQLSRITERTDIYGLGAILYEILTGQPPFPLDVPSGLTHEEWKQRVDALCARIQTEPPPPPRQLQPAVPRPLEAICLHALAADPDGRYPSAQGLVKDVTSWLAGEPVSAYPEPWFTRARRWSNRNKAWVIATSSAVMAALTLMILANNEQDRQRLAKAQVKTRAALVQAEQSAAAAQRAEEAARKSARLVSQQRDLALVTIRTVSHDLHAELSARPAMEKPRKRLLEQALAGLKKVAQTADNAEEVDHHLSWVHREIGRLLLQYGGSLMDAKAEFDRARALAQDAYDARPGRETRRDLMAAYQSLGDVSLLYGQRDAARQFLEQSLRDARAIAAEQPDAAAQRDLAVAFAKMGEYSQSAEDLATARQYFQSSRELREQLAARDSADSADQQALSVAYQQLGAVSLLLDDLEAARDYFQKDLERTTARARADETNTVAQANLAASYDHLGDLHLRLDQVDAALEFLHKGRDIHERLVALDPASTPARRGLALSDRRLGSVQLRLDNVATARGHLTQGLELFQALARADTANATAQHDLCVALTRLGEVAYQVGDLQQARGYFTTAHDSAAKLAQGEAASLSAQFDRMKLEITLGKLDYEELHFAAALTWLDRAGRATDELAGQGKLAGTPFSVWPKMLAEERAEVRATPDLLQRPAALAALPPARQRRLLELLVKQHLKDGRPTDALAAARQLAQLKPPERWSLWQAARVHGLIVQALPSSDPRYEPAADQAVALLRQAVDKGLHSAELLQQHAHLAALRERPAFQRLLKEVAARER